MEALKSQLQQVQVNTYYTILDSSKRSVNNYSLHAIISGRMNTGLSLN